MPIDDRTRGQAMVRRVGKTAERVGVSESGRRALEVACRSALRLRELRLDDDHDPHYLHPGRSALILLLDTGELNPVVLAAAALVESRRPDLRVDDVAVRRGAGEGPVALELGRALSLRAEVPPIESPDLIERLVTGSEAVRRVALAERLDHVRHAHMWHEGTRVPELLEEVWGVWIPVAERSHARLALRFRHWAQATERRLNRRAGGP